MSVGILQIVMVGGVPLKKELACGNINLLEDSVIYIAVSAPERAKIGPDDLVYGY